MGTPRALPSCSEVLWDGGGLSRDCSPLALRKQAGKDCMGHQPAGVCVCVCVHPRLAGDRLPFADKQKLATVATATALS